MSDHGSLRPDGDRCAVRFEQHFDATPTELWAALTDPEQLRGWLADTTRFELHVGGAVEFDFGGGSTEQGVVRQLEAERLIEYTWTSGGEQESVVRFEIVPREHGCLLVLDHRQLTRDAGAEYGAGWHAHLDLLEAALAGGSLDFVPRYLDLRPAYEEQAAVLGTGWDGPGGTPLLDALARGDVALARKIADAQPELRERPDAEGLLPAMRALYTHGRELAEALAPPDDRLDVFHAAALGRTGHVRELLDGAPSLCMAFSPDGFTPLHLACFAGGAEVVRILVEHDAPLETLARHAQARVRPLGTAAFSRDPASVRVLLEAGADPNGPGEGGFTPLHTAAQNGDTDLVRLLLDHGADPGVATSDGKTPEHLAREAGHDACADLVACAPAAVPSRD